MSDPRRAFVLAAGLGTRLRPLTAELPKPAWPFFDVPLAAHVLASLKAAGVGEVIVNLHHLGDRLKEELGPWIPPGLEVLWSPEEPILGTGGALVPWRERLADGPFFLCNADTIQELDLAALARFHRARRAVATLAVRPAPVGTSAPIELGPDGRILRFLSARAPDSPGGTPWEFTGVHLLQPDVLQDLPQGRFCINADLHTRLVARGVPLYGYASPGEGFWSDLGTPESYLSAHREFLTSGRLPECSPGRLLLEDGRTSEGGEILAPCYLGPGAGIRGESVIGPFAVLGAGAVVEGRARVRESVLWSGCRIEGATLERTIVSPSGRRLAP